MYSHCIRKYVGQTLNQTFGSAQCVDTNTVDLHLNERSYVPKELFMPSTLDEGDAPTEVHFYNSH